MAGAILAASAQQGRAGYFGIDAAMLRRQLSKTVADRSFLDLGGRS
jgi:hypothetical protein